MRRAIVLDTSSVRGTPKRALAALTDAGFEVRVSGLAIDELAVHFREDAQTEAERATRERVRNRLVFLRSLVDDANAVAPTHGALIDKLGGRSIFAPRGSFSSWHRRMMAAWNAIVRPEGPTLEEHEFLRSIGGYVEETGDDWVDASRAATGLTPAGLTTEQLIGRATRDFLSGALSHVSLGGNPCLSSRFHAYGRLAGLHAARTDDKSRRAPTRNDAIDLNLMHHLAEGLIVVTRDYRLIEHVDACGTVQAPWVRCVGELLLGRAPVGPPWSVTARRAMRTHRPRTHESLRCIDEEGEAAARATGTRSLA